MAKLSSHRTRAYLDEFSLSGNINAVEMALTQEAPDVTCISDGGPRALVGNYGHNHTVRGFFDGSSSSIDALSSTLLGSTATAHYLGEFWGGVVAGQPAYESIVEMTAKPVRAASGAAVVLEMSLTGAGGISRGLVLASETVGSTTSLLTSVDEGSGSTNGTYQAVFRVASGTFTNLVMQVQDSSNNSTWGDSTGLTATFTAQGVSRVTSTAVLRQYKRVAATTFAGTDADVVVTGGIVAGSLSPI